MPYSTPPAWTTGYTITAADWDTYVKDNLDYLNASAGLPASGSGYVTVSNSTTETTIHTRSLAAGAMGAKGAILANGIINYQSHNAATTLTLRIKLGATTIFAPVIALNSHATYTTTNAIWWHYVCGNQNDAASQRSHLWLLWYSYGTNAGAGVSASQTTVLQNASYNIPGLMYNTSTENTAGALTFAVTGTLSTANANLIMRALATKSEIIYAA
jgi:hypothetical protein